MVGYAEPALRLTSWSTVVPVVSGGELVRMSNPSRGYGQAEMSKNLHTLAEGTAAMAEVGLRAVMRWLDARDGSAGYEGSTRT